MFSTLLTMVFSLALIVATLALMSILDKRAYDRWEADMRRKGLFKPLCDVTDVSFREHARQFRDRL